jgi:RecB family exonuclease
VSGQPGRGAGRVSSLPEQLPLEGMPRRLFACTPSRLTAFIDCPRRYRLAYVDRPAPGKGPPWAHNSMGAAVHAALKQWWDLPRSRRTPLAAGALLDRDWADDGFRDPAHSAQWRQRARTWVESYVAALDPAREPVGVERYVATRTDRLALSGRVDRIDTRGDEAVIVDYKTGRHRPGEADTRGSTALAMYALATGRTLRRPCHQVELHHLPSGAVVGWRHTEESLARHLRRAEQVAEDIVAATDTLAAGAGPDEVFPPRTGQHCGWCDFRAHCPEGQAAAPARVPWAGLDPAPETAPEPAAASGPGPADAPGG